MAGDRRRAKRRSNSDVPYFAQVVAGQPLPGHDKRDSDEQSRETLDDHSSFIMNPT